MTDSSDKLLLDVRNVAKHYSGAGGVFQKRTGNIIRAVDDVSFQLYAGETLALVGESGCGKSTLARTLMQLETADAGSALYRGADIFGLTGDALLNFRKNVQIVFQDPYASLNPRMSIAKIISEPWEIHANVVAPEHRAQRIGELLEQVGLHANHANRYPHQFSGGQRQRIGIARALALNPELLILDEPVSALDMSIQAQVINLLQSLRARLKLSYLFIAHDLAVVRHVSHRVAVMYLGAIVEQGATEDIFTRPSHPYTQALLAASPNTDPEQRDSKTRIRLDGDRPDPGNPPSGCRFRTRCWQAKDICAQTTPLLRAHTSINAGSHASSRNGSFVACHFPGE